jgi:hypothetical protein
VKTIATYKGTVNLDDKDIDIEIIVKGTTDNKEVEDQFTKEVKAHGDEILDSLLKFIGWLK